MKPIFTIHAGEYLVGTYLETHYKDYEVWVPSKDTGIDFLVTNKNNRSKNVTLQVKFSKDFLPEMQAAYHSKLKACGWWTLNPDKIKNSSADLWVIAAYSFRNRNIEVVIIEPVELYNRLIKIHGEDKKNLTTYLWVTDDEKCFETRGLSKNDMESIIKSDFEDRDINRDFTQYLNAWGKLNDKLNL